ncbi:MAG: hypothetical protein AAF563_21360 [Pseudomonadota bacterium]
MVAHVGLAAMSGLAMAAQPADDAADDWPFGAFVICTPDGVQVAGTEDAESPAHANFGDHCSVCITACCGGLVCERAGGALVLHQPRDTALVGWPAVGQQSAKPAATAILGSRGPPFSV